jgi:hypothetical protein
MRLALIMLLASSLCLAGPNTPLEGLRLCSNALDDCRDLVMAQDASITLLKAQNKALVGKLESQEAKGLPGWVWAVVGGLTGAAVVGIIKK